MVSRLPGDHTVIRQVPSQTSTPLKAASASFTRLPTSPTGPSEQLPTDRECSGGLGLASRLSPGPDLNAEASGAQLELGCPTRQDCTGWGRQRRGDLPPRGLHNKPPRPCPRVWDWFGLGRAGRRKYANCIPPGPSGCTCAITCCRAFPSQSP